MQKYNTFTVKVRRNTIVKPDDIKLKLKCIVNKQIRNLKNKHREKIFPNSFNKYI